MKYYVEYIGDQATIKTMPHDFYLEKMGLEADDGLTWAQACDRVASFYDGLAKRYRMEAIKETLYAQQGK